MIPDTATNFKDIPNVEQGWVCTGSVRLLNLGFGVRIGMADVVLGVCKICARVIILFFYVLNEYTGTRSPGSIMERVVEKIQLVPCSCQTRAAHQGIYHIKIAERNRRILARNAMEKAIMVAVRSLS